MTKLTKICIALVVLILACTSGQGKQPQAEKVYRIVYEMRSNDWYKQQADLWKQEIERNPQNAQAWYNYYNANRYAHFEDIEHKDKKAKLDEIIEEMGRSISGTYEYYLLNYWNSYNFEDMSLIEKAYALDSMRSDTYYPIISHAEITGDKIRFKKFCEKLYQAKDISAWLLDYNYNVLMSLEPNAVLFTNGDNDTYPVWMLQQVKGIRPDVTLINISMASIEKYIDRKLEDLNIKINFQELFNKNMETETNHKQRFIKNLYLHLADAYPDLKMYFALTVYKDFIGDIADQLFVTGLAYRFSRSRIDNLAILKKNVENRFRLDYLTYAWYREGDLGHSLEDRLNLNYVVPMVMLAEHYQKSGQEAVAAQWKEQALSLAEKAKNEQVVAEIESKLSDL